jgi:hypothetical protein
MKSAVLKEQCGFFSLLQLNIYTTKGLLFRTFNVTDVIVIFVMSLMTEKPKIVCGLPVNRKFQCSSRETKSVW